MTCANTNSAAYKNLYKIIEKKLGSNASNKKIDRFCYTIWNRCEHGIDNDGYPTIQSMLKMGEKLRQYILSTMTDEGRTTAEARITKYIEDNPVEASFGIIKTLSGAEISPEEKGAFINMFFNAAHKALLVRQEKSVSWGELVDTVKKSIRDSKNSNADKYNALLEKYKNVPYEELPDSVIRDNNLMVSWDHSYNKLLDDNAFKQLSDVAKRRLIASGISRSNGNVDGSDIADTDQATAWAITDQFKIDERSYSTGKIKLLMSSLKNHKASILGQPALYTQDEAYRSVMAAMSHLPVKTYEAMYDRIVHLGESIGTPDNMYRQLATILQNGDPSLHFQFQTAMNNVRTDHMSVLISPSNNSDVRVVSAQMNSLKKTIKNSWQSNMLHNLASSSEGLQSFKTAGSIFLHATTSEAITKHKAQRMSDPKFRSLGDSSKNITAQREVVFIEAKRLLDVAGIFLSDETWSLLYNGGSKDIYKRSNGLTTKARSFGMQADPTTGVFGILASAMSSINTKSDTPVTVVTNLDQSILTFLSNIESLSSDKFASNNFVDYNGNKVFGYANSTPLHSIIGKLKGIRSYVTELLETEYTRFSYFLDEQHFLDDNHGNESDFKSKFVLAERFGIKQIGKDFKAQKEDLSPVDIEQQAIGLFVNNGSEICFVGNPANADKKRSTLIGAPREQLDSMSRESIMRSTLMSHCLSVVKAEASRINDLFASVPEDESSSTTSEAILKKHDSLKKMFGKNYITNGQFFHSYPFLNKILLFDNDFNINIESISKLALDSKGNFSYEFDRELRGIMADYFLEENKKDIDRLQKLGLYQKDSDGNVIYAPVPIKYAELKDDAFKGYKDLKLGYKQIEKPKYVKAKTTTSLDNTYDESDGIDIDMDSTFDSGFFAGSQEESFNSLDLGDEYFDFNPDFEPSDSVSMSKDARSVLGYNEKIDNILRLMMLEMRMNTDALASNITMVTSGDMATAMKGSAAYIIKNEYNKRIDNGYKSGNETKSLAIELGLDTFSKEFQKRLMSKIAPATDANNEYSFKLGGPMYTGARKYRVAFAMDLTTKAWASDYLASISSSLGLDIDDVTSKATDGCEYVSVFHRLEAMYRLGRINEREFVGLRRKYMTDSLSKSDSQKIMLGTEKPRQVGFFSKVIGGKKYRSEVYIKSAEVVLMKEFTSTANPDIDIIRQFLEHGYDIDPAKDKSFGRLAHASATKIGAQNPITIYSDDSSIKYGSAEELYNAITVGDVRYKDATGESFAELDWDSFGIQQEMPYDPDKKSITRSSQANNTILAGVKHLDFKYRGTEMKGSVLEAIKDSILKEKLARDIDKAKKDVGVKNGVIRPKEIFDVIKKSKDVSSNDVAASYFLAKNRIPFILSNNRQKIESLLFSKFNKGVMVPKVPGLSYPQMPLPGKGQIIAKNNNSKIEGLVRVSEKQSDGTYKASYDGKSPLKFTNVSIVGDNDITVSQTAEIIVPFKFIQKLTEDAGLASINDFIDKETGLIDSKKIPENVLKIIGLRIPNQGHSSQILLKIVGFTPASMGDVCFVPFQITTQMGSDFDIDKLFTYWRSYVVTNSKKIRTAPKNILDFNASGDMRINRDAASKWAELISEDLKEPIDVEDVITMAIDDAYFDIFQSVLSNALVARSSMAPLDADDLLVLGEENRKPIPKGSFFSFSRQNSEYILQQESRGGIDIYSKSMTSLPVFEGKFVQLGSYKTVNNVTKFIPSIIAKFARVSNGKKTPLALSTINPFGESTITYGGSPKKRTGLKNTIILQTESIDNANRDALVPNNLNEYTFNIASAMVLLSDNGKNLDLSYVTRFLNQEAIHMLVDKLRGNKGVIIGGNKKKVNTLIAEVKYELLQKYGVKDVKQDINRSYTSEELLSLIRNGQDDKTQYVASQFDMLDLYEKLKEVASNIFSFSNFTSFDNKGMRPAVEENDDILDRIDEGHTKLASNTSNPDAAITTIVNGVPKGNASRNNVIKAREINSLISDSVGHTSSNPNYVMHYINSMMRSYMGEGNNFTSEFESDKGYNKIARNTVLKSLQSFLTSQSSILKGLHINDFIKTKLLTNSYYELKDAKQYPELLNNTFFNSIAVSENLEHLYVESVFGDDDMSEKMSKDFLNMYRSSNPKIHQFAENLVKYELLSGGTQGPKRMIRYIDPYVLDNMGYYSDLKNSWNNFLSGNKVDDFIDLMFANNPQLFKHRSFGNSVNKTIVTTNADFQKGGYKYIVNNGKYYKMNDSIATSKNNVALTYTEIKLRGSEFEKVNNSIKDKADKKSKYAKKTPVHKYYDFSLDKQFAVIKTNLTSIEIIGENGEKRETTIPEEVYSGSVEHYAWSKNGRDLAVLNTMIDNNSSAHNILDAIMTNDSPVSNSAIVAILNKHGKILGDIKVARSESSNKPAYYDMNKNIIVINNKLLGEMHEIYSGSNMVEEILSHEIMHAIHTKAYLLGKNGVKDFVKIYNDTNQIYDSTLFKIQNMNVVSMITGKPLVDADGNSMNYNRFLSSSGITYILSDGTTATTIGSIADDIYGKDNSNADKKLELISALNPFIDEIEFSAEVSGRKQLQSLLSGLILNEDELEGLELRESRKSLYQKFVDMVIDLFKFLKSIKIYDEYGHPADGRSVFEAGIINNFNAVSALIEKADVVKNSASKLSGEASKFYFPAKEGVLVNSVNLNGTIREFLSNSTKDVRAGFRNLLNNKLIKTKCD